MTRVRIDFRKQGAARHLSHLDLVATFEFSLRRAALPVELSEGFNPRPRMSIAAPLPLGHRGECEILEITLREPVPPEDLIRRLRAALPHGIEVVDVTELPPGSRVAASLVTGFDYRVDLPHAVPELAAMVSNLLARSAILIDEDREGMSRTRDIRPLILKATAICDQALALTLRFGDGGTVRPEQILAALGLDADGASFTRERIHLGPS